MNNAADFVAKAKDKILLKSSEYAEVYRLSDDRGKRYILKEYRKEYANEARSEYLYLQALKQERIVQARAFIESPKPAILLDYIEGEILSGDLYKDSKAIEPAMVELAYSLFRIHSYGICLNDLKPENLIFYQDQLYIADLDVATVNLYFDSKFRGTMAYSAPEKILRSTNHFAADVFAIGMIVFYLKQGRTFFDFIGEKDYYGLLKSPLEWKKKLDLIENDPLLLSLLAYHPDARPTAFELYCHLCNKNRIKIKTANVINNYIFKCQHQALEKIVKHHHLIISYADESQVLENLLSLWSETKGRRLLILDESLFVYQPEEFFNPFPIGYREQNIYQHRFIEWLQQEEFTVLLRRSGRLKQTGFFDQIMVQTDAMQYMIDDQSEVKCVSMSEINELLKMLGIKSNDKKSVKSGLTQLKPFQIRLELMAVTTAQPRSHQANEMVDLMGWLQSSIPLFLAEKLWGNWYILIQQGLLARKLKLDGSLIRAESSKTDLTACDPELIERLIDTAEKYGFNNIAGEAWYHLGDSQKAMLYWTLYTEELSKNQYFLSAYEFVRMLRARCGEFPFELRKKEAFLARICGHFETSNQLYEELISNAQGIMKAVLEVDRAIVLQALKQNDAAIAAYQSAINVFRIHQDYKSLFRAMNNLGVVYFGLKRYTDAEQLFNDVLHEARQHNSIQFETISYLNLSDIQLKRGDFKRSLYYAEKASQIAFDNQKWNLFANGCVIQARAHLALGDADNAIRILEAVYYDPKTKENLLQYQEVLAWLLHACQLYYPSKADEFLDKNDISEDKLHEILLRELFFLSFIRKRFVQANRFISQLADDSILVSFFNSDFDAVLKRLQEYITQSEIDSALYYLSYLIRIFPDWQSSHCDELVNEAIDLYAYHPIKDIIKNNGKGFAAAYWADAIEQFQTAPDENTLATMVLHRLAQIIPADKYCYIAHSGGNLTPILAFDSQSNTIPAGQLLLSQGIIDKLHNLIGYTYLYPISDYLNLDPHSSALGLGLSAVCSYTVTFQDKAIGIFYADAKTDMQITDERQAALKTLFHLAAVAICTEKKRILIQEKTEIKELEDPEPSHHQMVGNSKAMRDVHEKIAMVAGYDINVLITGPTGSGKELVARAIHTQYNAKNRIKGNSPFIALNCAAIPEQLLESELFGYKKGAFTGADNDKKGKILLADRGSLFLDEIGEMPLMLQSKLLRVIQERVVNPLGSDQDYPVKVRIIAATNQNLEEQIQHQLFRADLYYRIKVMTIDLPPLSERSEDIPLLAMHFLSKFNTKFHKQISGIHPATIQYLKNRQWKGNIRELENEIERAVLLCSKEYLGLDDFTADADSSSIYRNLPLDWLQYKEYKNRICDELDRRYISQLMAEATDNIQKAGKIGKLERMQIYRLLKKKSDR